MGSGSAGVAPQGSPEPDLFAVNSLELYPYAGCGSPGALGCGRLGLGGAPVRATGYQWRAYEAPVASLPWPGLRPMLSTP